jgi:GPH family glycoside/pentoside/hexuronide:cation symporter
MSVSTSSLDLAGAARDPLTAFRKIAIGVGDFGFNFYWQVASLYLLYFYTDVLKLPPAVAGSIYMAALIWDAVLDPIVGLLADRTRSRFGRYRPYLLFGSGPLAATFVMLFAAPAQPVAGAVALTIVTHFAFRTLYAVVLVPYAALSARVTRDGGARADIAAARMVSATLAAVLVATATLPLASALTDRLGQHRGWMAMAGIYALGATAIILLSARAARGLDRPTFVQAAEPAISAKLRATGSNGPLMLVVLAVGVTSFANTIFQKNLLYYFKYVLGDARLGSLALGVFALVSALCVPAWTVVARRFGKRTAWLAGIPPVVVGAALWRLADGHGLAALLGALSLMAVGSAAYYVSFWAMTPDTVEYGEWKTGVRSESFAFGLLVLGQKTALGLGAGFLGFTLSQVGYAAGRTQSPATLDAIKAMMFWAPLIGGLVAASLVAFYPISPARHRRITEEIAARPQG